MLGNLSGMHLVVILVVILLLFGAPKLPALARSLGQSMRILKKEVRETTSDDGAPEGAAQASTTQNSAAGNSATAAPRLDADTVSSSRTQSPPQLS